MLVDDTQQGQQYSRLRGWEGGRRRGGGGGGQDRDGQAGVLGQGGRGGVVRSGVSGARGTRHPGGVKQQGPWGSSRGCRRGSGEGRQHGEADLCHRGEMFYLCVHIAFAKSKSAVLFGTSRPFPPPLAPPLKPPRPIAAPAGPSALPSTPASCVIPLSLLSPAFVRNFDD